MVTDRPPYDATVENIRTLCREFRDVSDAVHDDLKEQTDELNGSTFDRNIEAAVILGLFDKSEDGFYSPTKRGKRIGYGLDDGEERTLFRDVIRESSFYRSLLGIVGDNLSEKEGEQYLSRDDVMKETGINFDFGVGDRTLESASATFLRVMDAAGLGVYTRGRGDYPTRLVVNDEYTDFLRTIGGDEGTTEKEMSQEKTKSTTEERDKQNASEPDQSQLSQVEEDEPKGTV